MHVYLDEFALNDQPNGMHLDEPIEGVAGLPTIRTSQGLNEGRDGGWTSKQNYDPRFMVFEGRIHSRDVQALEQKRREFTAILARKRVVLRIVTRGGESFSTDVVVLAAPMPMSKVVNKQNWRVEVKADDPIFYDNTDGDLMAIISKTVEGGFPIPFGFPLPISAGSLPTVVTNTGNESVSPLIVIKTEASNPQLINRRTGEMIRIEAVVYPGSELRIDMKNKIVTLDGLNVYGLRSEGSTFWRLEPGENLIELITSVPSESSQAEIWYRSGFIGI